MNAQLTNLVVSLGAMQSAPHILQLRYRKGEHTADAVCLYSRTKDSNGGSSRAQLCPHRLRYCADHRHFCLFLYLLCGEYKNVMQELGKG